MSDGAKCNYCHLNDTVHDGVCSNCGRSSVVPVPELPGLELSINTLEDTNFGDHGAYVRKAHGYVKGELIEALVQRVLKNIPPPAYAQHNYGDVIEIRVVVGTADPKPSAVSSGKDPWE